VRYRTLGLNVHGGMAEYVAVPAITMRVLPPGLSIDHAALAQPLAVGVHAARRAGAAAGDRIVVIGAGAIGSFVLAGLRHLSDDYQIIVVDIAASRLARAERLGTDMTMTASSSLADDIIEALGGIQPDVVIEASGAPGCRLNLQPRGGRGWFGVRRPARLRATYNRTQGVRHMFGALDLGTGQLYYRIRDRKRWTEFLAFLKSLRARWPGQKLYLICDNYSVQKWAEVRAWCADNHVELVFGPTYSSWLNRIECEFAALLLRVERHRPPLPYGAGHRDRLLHPLAQPTRHTYPKLRSRLQDPTAGLPTERCLTRH
jgi:hypothetical protein